MTFRTFHARLCQICSNMAFADSIVGNIMDEMEIWEWDAIVPDKYIKIHFSY